MPMMVSIFLSLISGLTSTSRVFHFYNNFEDWSLDATGKQFHEKLNTTCFMVILFHQTYEQNMPFMDAMMTLKQ